MRGDRRGVGEDVDVWPVVLWGTERSRRAWGKKDARDGHLLADSCLCQVAPADPDLPLDVVR